ncbi:TonB-dependent receptor [uncultured Draconibacterium sp.]|uniref:TonB-dependent receptor n=1 Tax=uncultured Draconibacterium sp. TaxID=1573823 RepID=UPI003261BB92
MKRKVLLIPIVLCLFLVKAYSQEKYTISGIISDAENGETMIGATISVKELSATGTITNAYGYYSLTLPKGEYTVVFSYIGYQSVETIVNLNDDKRLDYKLSADSETLEEIVVNAKKKNENIISEEIGIENLKPQEIKKIPVLFGEQDVIKTLTLTPGVKTSAEGSGGMFVRGGNNSQNLVLLDEATVYNSSHLMGFFSTFNSDAIKDLTLYKGTAPSQYGGRISSVMDVKMNEGNNQKYHVGGSIGLISAKANIEGPIIKDKGSFLITGRRTYADMFLKLSSDESLNNNQLYFYDFNAKANYKINQNNRIFLSGYMGRDYFNIQDMFGLDWGNITGTLRWNHIWNSKLFSNTSLIYSDYDYKVSIMNESDDDFSLTSVIGNVNLKHDFQYFISDKNSLAFGLYGRYNTITPGQVEFSEDSDFKPIELQEKYTFETGAYFGHDWKPSDKWNISYGVRLNAFYLLGPGDFYDYTNGIVSDTTTFKSGEIVQSYYNIEPRLNMAYVLNQANSFKFSYTRNTQNLHLLQNSNSSTPTDIWISSSNNVKPEIGDQISLGYFRNFSDNKYQFSSEVYYKWMQNQIDLKNGAELQANEFLEGELLYGDGRAYGLELMLRKKTGRLSGWLSYTLSRTEKLMDGINENNWYPAKQDATHDISVVGIYDLSDKWSLSATWVYNTGNAVTFPSGKYEIEDGVQFYYTERNGYRMPAYHRLDLGATWNIKKTDKFESSLNFSIYNAYGRKNAYSIDFEEDENDPTKTVAIKTYLFTYIPSITYNFKF